MAQLQKPPAVASPDIDRILDAIRKEARARGSRGTIGPYPPETGGAVMAGTYGLEAPKATHVADYLALPLDVFIAAAYRNVLGRDADASGAVHYQRMLLRGRLTRVEVLGRLAYSPEGRERGKVLPGLGAAFVLATIYRIPLAGPALAFAARILRLPAHLQDRAAVESAALASGSWMKR